MQHLSAKLGRRSEDFELQLMIFPPTRSLAGRLASTSLLILTLAACDDLVDGDDHLFGGSDVSDHDSSSSDRESRRPPRDRRDVDGDDDAELDDDLDEQGSLMRRWGTAGSTSTTPRSSGGYGFCGVDDIQSSDLLAEHTDSTIPELPWGTQPVEDELARCGDDQETMAWRLMNCERMTTGLEPLECDLRLVWLGRKHSLDMAERDYFDHTNLEGDSPFDRMEQNGIVFSAAAENIAMYPRVQDASLGWMDSQGHRTNILSSSNSHAGVGIATVNSRDLFLTQLFIRPR